MARLNTYATDGVPDASDKVIGSDSTGTVTKNYPLGSIASWLKSSGATAVLGQNNFTFQTVADPQVGRLPGTFSLPVIGGDGTPFDAITALKFSQQSDTGGNVAELLSSMVGKNVILSQLDDLNSFGVYTLTNFTKDLAAPTFYDATLVYIRGNGALEAGKVYGYGVYGAAEASSTIKMISPSGSIYTLLVSDLGQLLVFSGEPGAPFIEAQPVISGTVTVGSTLTAALAPATGNPPPVSTLQWQRQAVGGEWVNIPGATGTTYILTLEDFGDYIQVRQTATNIIGSVSATSEVTTAVGGNLIELFYIDPFKARSAYFEGEANLLAELTALDNIEIL
jgi:hypothetical protein